MARLMPSLLAVLVLVGVVAVQVHGDVAWQKCTVYSPGGPAPPSLPANELENIIRSRMPFPSPFSTIERPNRGFRDDPPNVFAQCVNLSLPLWYDGSADVLNVFVKRIYMGNPGKDQMWMLNGGPGGAGEDLESWAVDVAQVHPNELDVYLIDHRGTGLSSRLDCTSFAVRDCVDELARTLGDKIKAYTITNAAKDLSRAIDLTRPQGARTFVYGISYGTMWGNRYLLVAPEGQATAVVLDGMCPPDLCRYVSYDVNVNRIGLDLMTHCSNDNYCRSRFSSIGYDDNPTRALYTLFQQMAMNDNPILANLSITPYRLSRGFSQLIADWQFRVAIPALVFRALRGTPSDIDALKAAERLLPRLSEESNHVNYGSGVLGQNIMLSEMWYGLASPLPADCNQLAEVSRQAYFATWGPPGMCPGREFWNTYTPDSYNNRYANTNVPVVIINGDMDPATPLYWAEHAGMRGYNKPNQRTIRIPLSPHGTFTQSPTVDAKERRLTCGFQITLSTFLNSDHQPDTSCLSKLVQIDFAGRQDYTQQVSRLIFNTPSLWD